MDSPAAVCGIMGKHYVTESYAFLAKPSLVLPMRIILGRRLFPVTSQKTCLLALIVSNSRGRMRKCFLLTFSLAACCVSVSAQDDVVSLGGVEIVRPAMRNSVFSTTLVQRLDATTLRLLGVSDVADAVKRMAGVYVRDYGGIGGMKTVSLHSLGAAHTSVVYDGVPLSNTQAGQIDIGRYSADNLDNVSMSMGDQHDIMSTASQYASAGVLSISSERPRFDKGCNHALRFRAEGGSFGFATPSLLWWQRLGTKTSLSVFGKFTRADGHYPFTLVNGNTKTRERRLNTDINSWQGEANLYHAFADGGRLAAKLYGYASRRGLPGVIILYAEQSRERMWDEDVFAQATYDKELGKRLSLSARLKYTHSWNKYMDWGSQYAHGVDREVNRQDEGYGSATLGWRVANGWSMALAADVSFNRLRNNIYVNTDGIVPQPSRWTSITALSLKGHPGRLMVDASLTYTLAAEHVSQGKAPDDKKRFTPSLSLSYRLLPSAPLYVRAMAKGVFRVPTFNDLYYRRLGNIYLKPEKASEYGGGLSYETHHGSLQLLTLTVDGYYNNVRDKIVAFPSTYVWRMANYGKVDIVGFDMTACMLLSFGPKVSLQCSAASTFQRAVDKTSHSSQSYDNQLPYTPRWSGSGNVAVTTPWVNIGYSVVMQQERYSMAQNKPEYRMRPFWDHSLALSRSFRLGAMSLDACVKATNITNAQYEIIKYYPMQGRAWTATLTWHIR